MSWIRFPFYLPCDSDVLFCYTMSARLCLFISFLPVALCRICWKDLIIFFVKYVWRTMLLNVTKLGTLIMINYDSLELRNLFRSAEAYYVIRYFLLEATKPVFHHFRIIRVCVINWLCPYRSIWEAIMNSYDHPTGHIPIGWEKVLVRNDRKRQYYNSMQISSRHVLVISHWQLLYLITNIMIVNY